MPFKHTFDNVGKMLVEERLRTRIVQKLLLIAGCMLQTDLCHKKWDSPNASKCPTWSILNAYCNLYGPRAVMLCQAVIVPSREVLPHSMARTLCWLGELHLLGGSPVKRCSQEEECRWDKDKGGEAKQRCTFLLSTSNIEQVNRLTALYSILPLSH